MNKKPEYRPIKGFSYYYVVSDEGDVVRIRTQGGRPIWRRLRHEYNSGRPTDRRPYVRLCKDGRAKKHYVSELVAEAFIGPRPAGCEVGYKDNDPRNNRADNLEYATGEQNRKRYLKSAKYEASQDAQLRNGWTVPRARWAA
jgi:hypothetical protein